MVDVIKGSFVVKMCNNKPNKLCSPEPYIYEYCCNGSGFFPLLGVIGALEKKNELNTTCGLAVLSICVTAGQSWANSFVTSTVQVINRSVRSVSE